MDDCDSFVMTLMKLKEMVDKQIESGVIDSERLAREFLSLSIFDDVNAYNKSEKNLRECEPFEELYQKYLRRYIQYKDSFEDLYQGIAERVHRREYASGGEGTHRGYYYPSILDLIVTGVSRGKLLKRKPRNGCSVYEYLFDTEDNLICVQQGEYDDGVHNPSYIELFVREDNVVLSFEYEMNPYHGPRLFIMSECHYSNRQRIKYGYSGCWTIFNEKDIQTRKYGGDIMVEDYEYDEDGLFHTLHWARYSPSLNSLTIEKHCFSRDEEGNLSSFFREQTAGYVHPANVNNPPWFCQMKKKRKGITPFE